MLAKDAAKKKARTRQKVQHATRRDFSETRETERSKSMR